MTNKIEKTILLLITLVSSSVYAKQYIYQGKVEGMVCAFCTYNVAKKIAQIKSIDSKTVNLDLKSGVIGFVSSEKIDQSEVAKLFTDTGFKLLELSEVKSSQLSALKFNDEALISLSFASNKLSALEDILDAIGVLAASQVTQLSVSAPKNLELDILKPIIAGRQRAIKVNFDVSDDAIVKIKLSTVL